MASVTQGSDFFATGGPVQPERDCYVERAGDRALARAMAAGELCCVLGSRGTGKTSAMLRAASERRAAGALCAVVDELGAVVAGDDADPRRALRAIAARIAREVGLDADVEGWWKARATGDAPLADFLWQVVLANTTAPIAVFLDDAELWLGLPVGAEILATIEACRVRRTAEPDYRRLTFVVLGVVSLRQLTRGDRGSPFGGARVLELGDFEADEAYRLAAGFGGGTAQAQGLMDRVLTWTGGHPALTQRLARAVERKGGKLEDVERAVRELWLAATPAQPDPVIDDVRARLGRRDAATRQAVKLLRRVARGASPKAPAASPALEVLQLAGVVSVDANGRLAYRNRLFRELVGMRWLKSVTPVAGKVAAGLIVVLAAAAAGGWWYVEYLPRPMLAALTAEGGDGAAAEDAYRRLRRLPGFAERAESLYADYLIRRAGSAATLADVAANDARLRALDGGPALADRLLAEFWFRKAEEAERAEQRDAAILYAVRAAGAERGAALLAELVGDDYARLERTARLAAAPLHWTVDWRAGNVATLDAANNIARTPLPAASEAPAIAGPAVATRLTALQYAPLRRELAVDAAGSAGAFELVVDVAHPASAELLVVLTAPDGAQASVPLPQGGGAAESFVLSAAPGSPLASLADEERRGTWRLAVVDRAVDNTGFLGGWGLRFGEDERRDELAEPLAIPDPQRTADVSATVSPDGAFAWASPAAAGALGSVALWNVPEARLERELALPAVPRAVALNAGATRLLATSRGAVTLVDVTTGAALAQLTTQSELVLPPTFSTDGGYFMIAERVEDAPPLYSLLAADDGALLGSTEGADDARDWVVGPGARYVVLRGDSNELRVLDPRRGGEFARLAHPREVRRVLALADGASLLTVDGGGDVRLWRLGGASVAGRAIATTVDADSLVVAADGSRLALTGVDGAIRVLDAATGGELFVLPRAPQSPPARVRLSPDGAALVVQSGLELTRFDLSGAAPAAGSTALLPADVTAAALDRGAELVAFGSRGGQVAIRRAQDAAGAALDYFGHRGAVTSIAVDAPHALAITGGADGDVRLWDAASGAPRTDEIEHGAPVVAVAIAPDGARVASAGGTTVRLWQTADAAPLATLPLAAAASALAFAPDGTLAIGDAAGTVVVRSGAESEPPVATLRGAARIASLAVSADGLLVAGDDAGTVRLWRIADGAALGAPAEIGGAVRWVGFADDGKTALAVGDRWLHSYAVDAAGLVSLHARPLARPPLPGPPVAAGSGERLAVLTFGPGGLDVAAVDLGRHDAAPLAAALAGRDWPAALGLDLDAAGTPVRR